MGKSTIAARIMALLSEIAEIDEGDLGLNTQLIGQDAVIDSRGLVELLLEVEDFVETEMNCEFDWTSDTAFSQNRSAFRSIDSLADYIVSLSEGIE